ncbi:MAG: T9SS type A sorting domain-containing protein [Candidatus Zixiibacteriota bacterium]
MIQFHRPWRPDRRRVGAVPSTLVTVAVLCGTLILLGTSASAVPLAVTVDTLAYGTTIERDIAVVGEVDTCLFDANAGDAIVLRLSGGWANWVVLELYDTLNVLLAADTGFYNARIDTVLADSGQYTVVIKDAEGDNTDVYGISLQRRFSPGAAVALAYGQTVVDTTTMLAEMHAYTIAATAGDRIIARLSSAWTSSARLELYDPTGSLLDSANGTSAARIDTALASTGTYTLLVMDREGNDVGAYGVHVQRRFQPGSATVTAYGETKSGDLAKRAEIDAYTFVADDGDRIIARASGTWSTSPQLELYDSLGGLVATDYSAWGARIDTLLADSGQYTLLVMDREGNDVGVSYGVHVQRRFSPGNATVLTYGETVPGSFAQRAEIDAYTFSGTAADWIVARMRFVGSSFGQMELYNASGTRVAIDSVAFGTRIDTLLAETETYTLLVMAKDGDYFGNYGLHLQRRFDPGTPVAIGYGWTVADTFHLWAEIHAYTFSVVGNDRIVARVSGNWQTSGQMEIYNPSGVLVASAYADWGARIDTLLTTAGTYTLLVMDREGNDTGLTAIYGLHIQRKHSPGSAVALAYGQTLLDTITQRAEIQTYTIAATAGDRIITRANSIWQASTQIELYNPVGGLLLSQYGTGTARIDTVLSATGNYTLMVMDREGDTTGVYGIHLQRRNGPASATALAYGQTIVGATTKRAEIQAYTIAATAGDRIVTRLSSAWTSSGRLELYDSTGGLLASNSGSGAARIDTVLAITGAYTLLAMDAEGDDVGSYGIHLQRRFNPGNADTLAYDQTDLDTLTQRAEIQAYKITTTSANERILVRMSGAWGASNQIELYNATGGLVAASYASGGTRIDTVLATAGIYTLLVMDREGDNTGTFGVHLQRRFNPVGAAILEYGQTASGTISNAVEIDAYTFNASAGDRIVARISTAWNPTPRLELYDSTSAPVATGDGTWGARIDTVLLKGGKYTLLVLDKEGDNTGAYGVHIQRRFQPGHGVPLLYGDAKTDTFTQWADIRAFTIVADSGDAILVRLLSSWQFSAQIELYDSVGGLVVTRAGEYGYRLDTILRGDGEYTLLVMDTEGDNTGTFSVHVQRKFSPARATALDYGGADSDTIRHLAETRAYTFVAEAGDRIMARMRSGWEAYGRLELYDSVGTMLASNQGSWGARIDTALTNAGKYTLLAYDPNGDNTGPIGVHIQRRFRPGHADTLDVDSVGYTETLEDTITHWAQSRAYTFWGRASDIVDLKVTSSWASHPLFELYDSTGTLVLSDWNNWEIHHPAVVLPGKGWYTLLIMDRESDDVGSCAVTLAKTFADVRELPDNALPTEFALSQNYPNPFNPATTIQYALRHDCHTTVTVFDILGRAVRTLVDTDQPAGRYAVTWDGRSDDGRALASGIYLYRIKAADFVATRKLVLLK